MRGKAGNVPFWPGGLEDTVLEGLKDGFVAEGKGIRKIPPGFVRGLRLPGEGEDETGLEELDKIQEHLPAGQGNVVKTSAQHRAYLAHEFP